jgi:hypothetical protein
MIIVVRISVLLIDSYMFINFGILLTYFIRKREQVRATKRTSRSYLGNFRTTLEIDEKGD